MKKEIKFLSMEKNKKDNALIVKIVERAKKDHKIDNGLSLYMALSAAKAQGCDIDFEKLLGFDSFNFLRDIVGISAFIDRETGKLRNCFVPRSARGQKK